MAFSLQVPTENISFYAVVGIGFGFITGTAWTLCKRMNNVMFQDPLILLCITRVYILFIGIDSVEGGVNRPSKNKT